MSNLPLADILAFTVIAACILMSLMRGVIAEVGSLVTWIVAFFVAKWFAVPFAEIAFKSVEPQALGVALAFIMLFAAAWLAQRFLRSLLTSGVSAIGLGSINRMLGGVFGAVKGVLLVTLAVMVCSYTDLPQTEDWQASYSIPYFETLARDVVMPYLPAIGDKIYDAGISS
ncbi:CvpA family protein [Neisseria sp. CCUG12390]|uniref:CvpA family protein n=1 Tax=Neisseria sp. CCUG12390 TaxID=3392035 RepID=UPI003A0FD674